MNYKEYCSKCEHDGIKLYTVADLIVALQQCPQNASVGTGIDVHNVDYMSIDHYGSDMLSVQENAKGNRVTIQSGYIGLDRDDADGWINPAHNVLVLSKTVHSMDDVHLEESLDEYQVRSHEDYYHDCDNPDDMDRVMDDDLHYELWTSPQYYTVTKIGHAAIIQSRIRDEIEIRRYVLNPYYNDTIEIEF
jgi:hypothetical protein